jgi:hypothetical protein
VRKSCRTARRDLGIEHFMLVVILVGIRCDFDDVV